MMKYYKKSCSLKPNNVSRFQIYLDNRHFTYTHMVVDIAIGYFWFLVFVDGNNSILSSTVHRGAQHIDIDIEGDYSFRFTVSDKALKSVETDN